MNQNEKNSPTMLIILDGFGYRKETAGNATAAANMPNYKKWLTMYPNKLISASGKKVGLLPGFIGNSEVGHTCMGSGQCVKTVLAHFHDAIQDRSFFKNKTLIKNFEKLKKENKCLHLMGLVSDGGVHSHEENLYAIIELAQNVGIKDVYIHAFLDGRDVAQKSAELYLKKLEQTCDKFACSRIASLHGRFYAMDRDNNWNRIQKTYDVLCKNSATDEAQDLNWREVLQDSYSQNITDEFVQPTRILKNGYIKPGDGVLFFNFRPDRARLLAQIFIDPEFNKFKTEDLNSTTGTLAFFITTTRYKKEFANFNNEILFEKEKIEHTLLDEISEQTKKPVFVIAETEKYAHVTYFFRGMTEKQLPNETYKLIPSIKVKTYVDNPEMSAQKITEEVLKSLQTDPAYFYLMNYANPDMVGHSGDFDATVKACEFLDIQLEKLYDQVVEKQNGTIFITADHGNAEEMVDEKTGKPRTAHTNNPVVFLMINKSLQHEPKDVQYLQPTTGVANIASTILKHLGLDVPNQMEQETIF